jgi:hypothetical protein
MKKREEAANRPFIDPQGYNRYIADRDQAFREELHKQQAATHP